MIAHEMLVIRNLLNILMCQQTGIMLYHIIPVCWQPLSYLLFWLLGVYEVYVHWDRIDTCRHFARIRLKRFSSFFFSFTSNFSSPSMPIPPPSSFSSPFKGPLVHLVTLITRSTIMANCTIYIVIWWTWTWWTWTVSPVISDKFRIRTDYITLVFFFFFSQKLWWHIAAAKGGVRVKMALSAS